MASNVKKHAQGVLEIFPRSELWRLFIDGYRQGEGKWAFDSGAGAEKGFYLAMQGSWDRMIDTVHTRLTVEEILKIHDYCVGRGEGQSQVENVVIDSNYRIEQADLGLVSISEDPNLGNVTFEGAKEFIQTLMSDNPPPVSMCYKDPESKAIKDFIPNEKKTIDENTNDFMSALKNTSGSGARLVAVGDAKQNTEEYIKQYHRAIKLAYTDDAKMLAIAKCVGRIERLHPFYDGNCRTMVILTNKLLLQNGLLPIIFKNPNQIEMFSAAQLVAEMKKGQKVFQGYQIGNAKKALESLGANEIKDPIMVQKAIVQNISMKPMPAMAQLGKIYEEVKRGGFDFSGSVPQRKVGKYVGKLFGLYQQQNKEDAGLKTENVVLIQIQQLYQHNLARLTDGMQKTQKIVDDLKAKKEEADDKLEGAVKAYDAEKSNQERKNLKEAILDAEGIQADIGRVLDRAQKSEQWYVDRLGEVKDEHKSLLSDRTSVNQRNPLSAIMDSAIKLANRQVVELDKRAGFSGQHS